MYTHSHIKIYIYTCVYKYIKLFVSNTVKQCIVLCQQKEKELVSLPTHIMENQNKIYIFCFI